MPARTRQPGPARLCEVEGCGDVHLAKGMCRLHYRRSRYRFERSCPEVVLKGQVSLYGVRPLRVRNIVCHIAVGVICTCPFCESPMGATSPSKRFCHGCGTTVALNPEEVEWVTFEARSTAA